jgi:hypothetical protein
MTYSPNFRGTEAKGYTRVTQSGYTNGTLSTITIGTPVSINGSGVLTPVDVTSEASVSSMVGAAAENIASAATGAVADDGRIQNITTAFNIGDALYVDKTGALTNIKPDIGVNGFTHGDFVVFAGVIVPNETNISLKDLKLVLCVVGQL